MKKVCFLIFISFLFLVSCTNRNDIKEDNDNLKTEYVMVEFKDYDDTLLYKTEIIKGSSISYPYDNPKRSDDEEYSYSFTGWDNSLENIDTNLVLHAVYEKKSLGWNEIIWFD